jgi:type I restriction enzyme, R subunit
MNESAFHPEDKARFLIDKRLVACGWQIQSKAEMNLGAGLGVAVREFQTASGPVDYGLFVGRNLCGVIEAKPEGTTLSGFSEQAARYIADVPKHLVREEGQVRFEYVASGTETLFRDHADPDPVSRRVFAFHRPETLERQLKEPLTLRGRLRGMPPLLTEGLRTCQTDAVSALESSMGQNRPRALVQMATGAGKTFTACTLSYRLLAHARFKRILFLADRANLVRQARDEYLAYRPPGTGRSFSEIYNVQKLGAAGLDKDAQVVVATIQRVYSVLTGKELSEEEEEASSFELSRADTERLVSYNPSIPIESFDLVITDECHRSIYGTWRQVLEYFDAFTVGLTATPSLHTLGFFGKNLVAQYPYERSVVDGVNVGFDIFRIRTEIGERGGTVKAGYDLPVRDKRTRAERYETLDADFSYTPDQIDRSVLVPNQIRTVLETYRDSLFTELFPGRTEVPKTLVFAKDDHHAEEITQIVREVFGKGNDFAKKITYKTDGGDPEALIRSFRNDYNPRIAVTVDMIPTGTDVKPLEVLIFLRDVKSELYFEQMKGRGARTIPAEKLREVTPDAEAKTRVVLIDAIGVSESLKTVSQPLERDRAVLCVPKTSSELMT